MPGKNKINKARYVPIGYDNKIIYLYFYIGILAAILLRVTLLLEFFSHNLAKLAWYLGVVGYMVFFMHRNRVSERRGMVIKKLDLLNKIEKRKPLDDVDFEGLQYILWSMSVSKERVNFLYIQIFSAISLLVTLVLDIYN